MILFDFILYLNELKESKYLNEVQIFFLIQSFELWKFSNKSIISKELFKRISLNLQSNGFTKVYKIPA
jgi:hypothetical protein